MEKKKTILKATKKPNLAAPAKKEGASTRKVSLNFMKIQGS